MSFYSQSDLLLAAWRKPDTPSAILITNKVLYPVEHSTLFLVDILLPSLSFWNCSIADHDSICGKAAIRIWAPDERYPVSYFQIG